MLKVNVCYEVIESIVWHLVDFDWNHSPTPELVLSDIFRLHVLYDELKKVHELQDQKHYQSIEIDSYEYINMIKLYEVWE